MTAEEILKEHLGEITDTSYKVLIVMAMKEYAQIREQKAFEAGLNHDYEEYELFKEQNPLT